MLNHSHKTCQRCKKTKPLGDFHKNRQTRDGKHTLCKVCNSAKASKWRAENPTKAKTLNYRKKYKLTYEQVEAMKVSCGRACEICGVSEAEAPREVLFVDHCHDTGEVRGILCLHCNNLLGSSKDRVKTLLSAVDYLREKGSK